MMATPVTSSRFSSSSNPAGVYPPDQLNKLLQQQAFPGAPGFQDPGALSNFLPQMQSAWMQIQQQVLHSQAGQFQGVGQISPNMKDGLTDLEMDEEGEK